MGHLMFDTPTFELHADNGPLEIRVAIAMMAVALVGVCLRFYAKRITRQSCSWDDGLIVLGLLCSWGVCIADILAVKKGNLGQHIQLLTSPGPLEFGFKAQHTQGIIYLFSLAFTKYSLSLFYRRLFQIGRTMNPLLFLDWFLGLRLIAVIAVAITPCMPIDKFWDRTRPGKCINTNAYLAALAVTNIGTYLLLLGYPIPIIWNLRVARAQKIVLLAVFVLGGFVVVVSCLRLVAIIELIGNTDTTWAMLPLALWTTVEVNIAVFCACIPVMRPLLNFFPGLRQVGSRHEESMGSRHTKWWPGIKTVPFVDNNTNFRMLHNGDADNLERKSDTHHFQTSVTSTKMELEELETPENGIHVERTIIWD